MGAFLCPVHGTGGLGFACQYVRAAERADIASPPLDRYQMHLTIDGESHLVPRLTVCDPCAQLLGLATASETAEDFEALFDAGYAKTQAGCGECLEAWRERHRIPITRHDVVAGPLRV